ncbi:MAG: YbjN domain-containing protein [Alphaproteobacteria bacterium]
MISSFDALKAQLRREDLPFREVEGERAVTLPTRLGDADSVLHIRWEPTPGVVQFIQPLPMTVPVDRRSDIGRALHRINLKLALLGFTYDGPAGIVAFRAQAMMAGGEGLLPGMIGLMIRTSIETAATHWPGLRAIAES